MEVDLRMLGETSLVTVWLNYFLLFLDFIIAGILVSYITPLLKREWNTPHVNFAVALLIWIIGIVLLRGSAVIRITKDITCAAHDCLGGGTLGKDLYGIGSIINCLGLLMVIRAIGIYRGSFSWLKFVLGAVVLSIITFIIISSLQGLF